MFFVVSSDAERLGQPWKGCLSPIAWPTSCSDVKKPSVPRASGSLW